MLPFGSILTQLPLLVIGALYMLYLGLMAVNKSKDPVQSPVSQNKEEHRTGMDKENIPDLFSLVRISQPDSDAVTVEQAGLSIFELNSFIPYYIYKSDPAGCCPDFALFSRPPPILG